MLRYCIAALVLSLFAAAGKAEPATSALQGSWASVQEPDDSGQPELSLLIEGEFAAFIRQRRAVPAALIMCDRNGEIPAKLASASSSQVTFVVNFAPSPGNCSAVVVTCRVLSPDRLSCSWVGRTSYLLVRKSGT
jgi:hypothetical protein